MKIFGIILIVVGILMLIFTGINFQTEKKVIDIGPIQVDKKENRQIGWPVYAGAVICVAGIFVVAAGRRK
jgi:uncharacterized membrane protein YidH (DUF202 family)